MKVPTAPASPCTSELMLLGWPKGLPLASMAYCVLYQLSDFYSLFYLRFIKGSSDLDKDYWLNALDNPEMRAWSGYAFEQVDLVIDRRDQVVNLCEMKFSMNVFEVDKRYADDLSTKIGVFNEAMLPMSFNGAKFVVLKNAYLCLYEKITCRRTFLFQHHQWQPVVH